MTNNTPEQSRQVAGNYRDAAAQAQAEGQTTEAQNLMQSADAHDAAADTAEQG